MLSNDYSVIEPIGSDRIFICLSSIDSFHAAFWHFPNGSMITNLLQLSNEVSPGIAVFYALPSIGVYQLRLNGYFSAQDSGRYQCISNNNNVQVATQNLYIFPEGTSKLFVKLYFPNIHIINEYQCRLHPS